MQRLLWTALVFAIFLGRVDAQDPDQANEPGPEHANLKAFVGTWALTAEGVTVKGSAEFKSILGGRFFTEDVKLSFGNRDMEWHGVYSYDRRKRQYTGVWFDNMANTTRSDSGEADKTGRILSFRGELVGHAKFLWRISNDGKQAMAIEMFEVSKEGKETLVMKVLGQKQK